MINEMVMQHGMDWKGQDVAGYLATEKYNGCRGYWDGADMWTRSGLKVKLPESWRKALPAGVHLDGEVYDGVDGFYRCESAVKYGRFTESMKFMVFDCPRAEGTYIERLNFAREFARGPVSVVSCRPVRRLADALTILGEVKARAGEGLILRDPNLPYLPGRSPRILKMKKMN
jgi:DNA ligase 1